jgi:hypothetical protein
LKAIFSVRTTHWDDLLNALVAFFKPDLCSLSGMSRIHEDWILDNILHPWPARCIFTIPEAIEALDESFDIVGTSPRFVQDWRWYKAIPGHPKSSNVVAQEEYERWSPYLLDYRVQPDEPVPGITAQLNAACESAIAIHNRIWDHDALNEIPQFTECLREVRAIIQSVLPETAAALEDYLHGLTQLLDGCDAADFGTFRFWFGRGQQYVSFSRR